MRIKLFLFFVLSWPGLAQAGAEHFSTGPVFTDYGENAVVEGGLSNPDGVRLKVAFDAFKPAEGKTANSGFNSIARFINMHAQAGVPQANIDVALVVHGEASLELLTPAAYQTRFGQENPSAQLLAALLDADVEIILCGQSAKYHGVQKSDLIEGVQMSLSAMTAHALLQQAGYSLNPF